MKETLDKIELLVASVAVEDRNVFECAAHVAAGPVGAEVNQSSMPTA
jgi:hypothetical protein